MKFLDLGLIFNDTFCHAYKTHHKMNTATLEIDDMPSSLIFTIFTTLFELIFFNYFEWRTGLFIWLIGYSSLGIFGHGSTLLAGILSDKEEIKILKILTTDTFLIKYLFEQKFVLSLVNSILYGLLLIQILLAGYNLIFLVLLVQWYLLRFIDSQIKKVFKFKYYFHYFRKVSVDA